MPADFQTDSQQAGGGDFASFYSPRHLWFATIGSVPEAGAVAVWEARLRRVKRGMLSEQESSRS